MIDIIKEEINKADALVLGIGSGLSTAAGLEYGGQRFETLFSEFIETYGLTDMYSSGFYNFETPEKRWAYWANHIYYNRYHAVVNDVYKNLRQVISQKDYFVITTNADHLLYLNGFDSQRIFPTQGDYGLLQCSKGCHNKVYDNESLIHEMIEKQDQLKVPSELVPYCPVCGQEMDPHLRKDDLFVETDQWLLDYENYSAFINKYKDKRILFIELGVGYNTPGIIKYQFWRLTYQFEKARYMCINNGQARCPEEIKDKSILINDNLAKILN